MIILLTENSPIGMLSLSSMERAIINFFPLGIYEDPLYETGDYLDLCVRKLIPNAINVCNNTPWSDMIWSNPELVDESTAAPRHDRQSDVYALKQKIFKVCGWKPNVIIDIYDKKPSAKWKAKVEALIRHDSNITVISLNASDPKFSKNIVDAVTIITAAHELTF
jgi:hypothetical protein